MALYSLKGAYPTELPNRIKLSNDFTKTDKTTFTDEDLSDAGWVEVESPPVVDYPNKLEWDGENMSWISREPNKAEIQLKWQEIKDNCKRLLSESDYKVIKAMEDGVELNPVFANYRKELRDLYNNVNDVDPWTVELPKIDKDDLLT